VLLVDDDESVRVVLRRYLELRGWRVVATSGGDEALTALDGDAESFDAVMVDLHLPDGCGGSLCRQIATRHPSLQGKLVMATGEPLAAVAALAREGVRCPVLSKPFDLLDFVHVLEGVSASA
jgi:two-component system cell cycle response regulator CpdR